MWMPSLFVLNLITCRTFNFRNSFFLSLNQFTTSHHGESRTKRAREVGRASRRVSPSELKCSGRKDPGPLHFVSEESISLRQTPQGTAATISRGFESK